MGISRQLQNCLLFSIAGHLVCFCSVAVLFPSIGFKKNNFSTVNFLGTLLPSPPELTGTGLSGAPSFSLRKQPHIVSSLPKSKEPIRQNTNSKIAHSTQKLDKKCVIPLPESDFHAHLFLHKEQITINPANIIGPIEKNLADKDSLKKAFWDTEDLHGLLKREIISQPPFPKFYELSEPKLKRNDAIFKIYISSAGIIEEIANLKFSGNPEMDMMLARHIRKWRFAPAFEQDGQWQIVKINFQTGISSITSCENN